MDASYNYIKVPTNTCYLNTHYDLMFCYSSAHMIYWLLSNTKKAVLQLQVLYGTV